MQFWDILLTSFGGAAAALAIASLLSRTLLSHWFTKNLEQYKSKISYENNVALEKIKVELQDRLRREDRTQKLKEVIYRYKAPLIHSIYELQSRIFNLVANRIIKLYFVDQVGDGSERDYIVKNTLFVIAQYFAWIEIIRKEIQFVELETTEETKKFSNLQGRINSVWNSERFDDPLMIWTGEQRGIGEIMIEKNNDNLSCIGYAKFLKVLEGNTEVLLGQLEKKVTTYIELSPFSNNRLVPVQNALIDLLDFLDPEYVRFPKNKRTYITY